MKKLKTAIEATFDHRETDIERRFFIYEPEYISEKEKLWKPFLKKIGSRESSDFSQVVIKIKEFLEPVIIAKESDKNLIWDTKRWSWKEAFDS